MAHEVRPFHLSQPQGWAEDQVRQHHLEALYAFGEYAMFVLMWRSRDFDAGLVGKCTVCQIDRIAQAYQQADQWKCESCFGTTFEGGYRARIIRPAIFTDRVTDTTDEAPRGALHTDTVTIETTEDFTLRHGDFAFRYGDLRYQTEEKGVVVVRSGFDYPDDQRSIAGTISSARLEAHSAMAYTLPPDGDTLDEALRGHLVVTAHLPPDLAALEEIRGPLHA